MPEVNPHSLRCPDFAEDLYDDAILSAMAHHNIDRDAAVRRLTDKWQEKINARIATWDAAEEVAREAREIEENAERDATRAETRKKRKMPVFDEDSAVDDWIPKRPSQYALNRLDNCKYVELWYFTAEGLAEAANQRVATEDVYSLAPGVGNGLCLKHTSNMRASEKVVPDAWLTWAQFIQARGIFLTHVRNANWTEQYFNALSQFLVNLELHSTAITDGGTQVLLEYQAQTRRSWHDKMLTGLTFNISIINETYLSRVREALALANSKCLEAQVS